MSAPSTRCLLVVNAHSRSGRAMGDAAQALLEARGCAVERFDSPSCDAVSPWIERHAAGAGFVMVAGGDGTLNAAARGLVATHAPLALIPAGTANDLARTLGVAGTIEQLVALPFNGQTRRIDLGEANGHLFFNVASIGLSVELAQALTPDEKRRLGRFSYVIAAARAMRACRHFRAVVWHDGEAVEVRTLQIAIGNGRYYGGGNAVHFAAKIDDGTLDLYSLELRRLWKLLLLYPAFKQGRHSLWREVRAVRGERFEVSTGSPRPVNLDGELKTTTPASFRVLPAAVTVYVP